MSIPNPRCIALMAILGLILAASAEASTVLFFDDFDATPAGVLAGQDPPSPYGLINPETANAGHDVEAGTGVGGTNALHIFDNDTSTNFLTTRTFTNSAVQTQFDFSLKLTTPPSPQSGLVAPILEMAIKDGIFGTAAADLKFVLGNVTANGNTIGTYTDNQFMDVTIVVRPETDQYDVFIPSLGIAATNIAFVNPAANQVNALFFATGTGGSAAGADAWIDNFSATIPEPASLALLAGGAWLLAARRRGA